MADGCSLVVSLIFALLGTTEGTTDCWPFRNCLLVLSLCRSLSVLKIQYLHRCVGSSPTSGTSDLATTYVDLLPVSATL
jgi:hypothetical protein